MAPARKRRQGVSGESVNPQQMDAFISPVHAKTPEERQAILASIDSKLKVLFGHLSLEHKLKVVDAFFPKAISVDETVIKQGDEGDNFYVIKEGCFDIYVTRPGAEAQKVKTCSAGDFFGELALLYNAPRAATVVATTSSHLWALDRMTFRMMLATAENHRKCAYFEFLSKVEIFAGLTRLEKSQLSDILTVQDYRPGEVIVRQDERGDKFYLVESGKAFCTIVEDNREVEVLRYESGGYFGELALLGSGIRKASVYALNRCRVLWIDKLTFDRVLGPIVDILRKQADLYPSYADVLEHGTPRHIH